MSRDVLATGLGALGLSLVIGFAVRTWLLGGVDDRGAILAVLAAFVLLAYAWLDGAEVAERARSRALQRGGQGALVVVGAGIAAVLVYAGVREVDDTVDLTNRGLHALTPHTLAVLDGLDREVTVHAVVRAGSARQVALTHLLRPYAERSPRLSIHTVDPIADPLAAQTLGVTQQAGELVFVAGDRTDRVVGRFDEDAVTDALVRVSSDRDHRVCWSEGHGEAEVGDTRSPQGAGLWVTALEGQNYQVMPESLLDGSVSPACELLVVAGPRADWLAHERAALGRWMREGGRLLALIEPGVAPALVTTLRDLGVRLGDDVVLEPDPERRLAGSGDQSVLLVPPAAFGDHPVTRGLAGAVVLGTARSTAATPGAPGVATRTLLHGSAQSWAEQTPHTNATPDEGETQGEIGLAVAVQITDGDALPDVVDAAAVGPTEVEARVRATLAMGGANPNVAPDASLASQGFDDEGTRRLAAALGEQLGVDLSASTQDSVASIATRARAALDARLPGREAPAAGPGGLGRAVVVGDADLLSNRAVRLGANRDFLLGTAAWLVGEDDQLGARPDDLGDDLVLTARNRDTLTLLVLAPAVVLVLLGLAMWGVRKRRRPLDTGDGTRGGAP